MGYPLLLAAVAATAAGTGMQMAGAAQSRSAMNQAQAAEMARQKRYQQQADASFQQSLKGADRGTADAQMTAGAERRTAAYDKLAAVPVGQPLPTRPPTALPTATGTAAAAARTRANATATANAWSKLVGGAQARLGGADDWQLEQGIKNTGTNRDLAIIGSNARGSANILPLEMEQASHAGDGLAGWGQVLSALGSVAGLAGATAPAAGASAASKAAAANAAASGFMPAGQVTQRFASNPWGMIPVK